MISYKKTFSRDITFLLASAGFYNFPEAVKDTNNPLLDSPVLKQVTNSVVEFWLNQELFEKENGIQKVEVTDQLERLERFRED